MLAKGKAPASEEGAGFGTDETKSDVMPKLAPFWFNFRTLGDKASLLTMTTSFLMFHPEAALSRCAVIRYMLEPPANLTSCPILFDYTLKRMELVVKDGDGTSSFVQALRTEMHKENDPPPSDVVGRKDIRRGGRKSFHDMVPLEQAMRWFIGSWGSAAPEFADVRLLYLQTLLCNSFNLNSVFAHCVLDPALLDNYCHAHCDGHVVPCVAILS